MKRTFLTLVLIFAVICSAMADRPKVALVLSGGGAKGSAHVGVIKVLEQNGIPVDMVVGASMGAVIGGLYCAGYTGAQMDSLMMIQDWNRIMLDGGLVDDRYLLKIPFDKPCGESIVSAFPSGLVRGSEVEAMFGRLLPGIPDSLDFNALPVPFACVSVDLVRKKEVVHHSGNLVEAIRASMAIPLFFEPVRRDGMVLIDGGMLNNYPVDIAREMGADIVIGVKVGEPEYKEEPQIDDIATLGGEWLEMYIRPKTAENIAGTDIFIGPSIGDMNVMSFSKECIRKLIDNGEAAAREVLPKLLELKPSDPLPERGVIFGDSGEVAKKGRPSGSKVSMAPEKGSYLALGGYFDTEEIIAARLDAAFGGNSGKGHKLNLSAKLAWNLQAEAQYRYDIVSGFGIALGYAFRNTNSNLFSQEDVLTCKYREHSFEAFIGYSNRKNLDLKAGVRTQMFYAGGWSKYLNFSAGIGFDNTDKPCFPGRGVRFNLGGSYFPAVLSSDNGFGEVNLRFSGVIPVGRRFAFIASVDHRGLFSDGGSIPWFYGNWMGGVQAGRYFDRQLPFAGFNHVNSFNHVLTAVSLDARTRIGEKHFLTASGAYALDSGSYSDFTRGRSTFGASLGYSYNSIVGPLSFRVSWSDLTKRVGFWAGVGLYL